MTGTATAFVPYGPSHRIVLALFALGALVLVHLGRRQRGTLAATRFARGFAVVNLLVLAPLQIHSMLPPQWSLEASLPLQLCDLAWMAAAWALWTRTWRPHALAYYWALTLSSQALLTPALAVDFPSPVFCMFWAMHLLIVWAAIYLTWGLGLAPDWRSYRFALAATLAWAALALAVDCVVGVNYGYLRDKPPVHSLLDVLGPWPWYLVVELGLVACVWAAITVPWVGKARPMPSS